MAEPEGGAAPLHPGSRQAPGGGSHPQAPRAPAAPPVLFLLTCSVSVLNKEFQISTILNPKGEP